MITSYSTPNLNIIKTTIILAISLIVISLGFTNVLNQEPLDPISLIGDSDLFPLSFEKNLGQADEQVEFLSRGSGYNLYLTPSETILTLFKPFDENEITTSIGEINALHMKLIGGNLKPTLLGTEELLGKTNYFIGNNSAYWRTNIPNYKKAKYQSVYPGIDLIYYGVQGQLEYDFVVSPGADPNSIIMEFKGVDNIRLDAQGNLILRMNDGELIQRAPFIYQDSEGIRNEIGGRYDIKGKNQVGFSVSSYDPRLSLVIDPVLIYSTYLGGSDEDGGSSVVVDDAGDIYVGGYAASIDFPITPGAFDENRGAVWVDGFISKFSANSFELEYSTFIGGHYGDTTNTIAVDNEGNVYSSGETYSSDFPTTPGAFDTSYAGRDNDAYILKLAPDGRSLIYSTYIGGSLCEVGVDLSIDNSGSAYLTGYTCSSDFPTTTGAFDTTSNNTSRVSGDVFVVRLNQAGTDLVYGTYLGGNSDDGGYGIFVDTEENAYLTGFTYSPDFPTTPGSVDTSHNGDRDAFVAELNHDGTRLEYGTFLGGSNYENGTFVNKSQSGNIFVGGYTLSSNFPATTGSFDSIYNGGGDGFIGKLNLSGSSLDYMTFIGGNSKDQVGKKAFVDSTGKVYFTGSTTSSNFPTTPGAYDVTHNGNADALLAILSPTGEELEYATFFGGAGLDGGSAIALDSSGKIYIAGGTESTNFPVSDDGLDLSYNGIRDGFLSVFTAINSPPEVDPNGPYDVDEGDSVIVSADGFDPDGDPFTYSWDLNDDGTFETPGQSASFSGGDLDGPDSQDIAVQVCDPNACVSEGVTVLIKNVTPTVGMITAPIDLVQVDTEVIVSADFTDPGIHDTHTAIWDWGDESTSTGIVNEVDGSGDVTGTHTYSSPGVYTVKVTVTDDDGDYDYELYQFVVVYDPDGGFVTGGGWIDSPPDAYTAEPLLTGRANFGFVSKYKKGANVPTGQTEFQFQVADLNFHSDVYDWLVVAGPKAKFKGAGTINGLGNYGFMLSALDEKLTSSTDVDLFRIKIWDKDNGDAIVYDNQAECSDGGDEADPCTEIEGGSIVIHKN